MSGAATVFVTGTDTGVGKTFVACGLLGALRVRGLKAAGFKPVASGAEDGGEGLRNEDALALQAASAPGLGYAAVNPYCFAPPVAPHLAARGCGTRIDPARLDAGYEALARTHDRVVVEGAGGWRVPLDEHMDFADWVAAHRWPVLLVVGIRLGCINHALLSADAILRRAPLLGWIANHPPPRAELADEIVETLRGRMPAPLLASVPMGAEASQLPALLARIDAVPAA